MKRLIQHLPLFAACSALLLAGACGDDGENGENGNGTGNGNGVEIPQCDASCTPANCQACVIDFEAGTATCEYLCADDLLCEMGQCVAPEETTCEPACGPCQTCEIDGSGNASCVDLCGANTTCENNVCVAPDPVEPPVCDPECGPCQVCDTSGDAPICIDQCSENEACNAGECVRAGFHANFAALQGPFESGTEVTQACIDCHPDSADQMLDSPHWRWLGPTPNLERDPNQVGEIGKQNLINNFCVSVPGNEPRCAQCHAGYDYVDASYDFTETSKMDCLVCHADPASGYKKGKTNGGNPADSVDLLLAAQSVGVSASANCGSCHYNAGGGDRVKKGDLGWDLEVADRHADVHMAAGLSCADCHADSQHVLLGQGVHTPVTQGRLLCDDCHGEAPHENAMLNNHALDIDCQTCHIPAFSRNAPTKTDWDWSTAGNRTIGNDGIENGTLEDGTSVQVYNYKKGRFVWEKNVKPTYAWHNGQVAHMTLASSYPADAGTTENPIVISEPLATYFDADAKIMPFKLMTGIQPAHQTERVLLAPDLFGPGGFWGGVPPAAEYTPEAVQQLWTDILTQGALLAGQLSEGETLASSDWDFVNTVMWMGINHEVAPADEALGANNQCADCHAPGAFPWTELGYACDPIGDPQGCGSRN
jgi:octaheme c-type cytochrome (tetrathionate reductase family)